jgi:hypothetical protein
MQGRDRARGEVRLGEHKTDSPPELGGLPTAVVRGSYRNPKLGGGSFRGIVSPIVRHTGGGDVGRRRAGGLGVADYAGGIERARIFWEREGENK